MKERNPAAAEAILHRIEEVVGRLADFPLIGHATDEPPVRIMPLGRYPYLVFYAVEEDAVAILHIRHAAPLKPWE